MGRFDNDGDLDVWYWGPEWLNTKGIRGYCATMAASSRMRRFDWKASTVAVCLPILIATAVWTSSPRVYRAIMSQQYWSIATSARKGLRNYPLHCPGLHMPWRGVSVATGDIDNDGDPDLFLAGRDSYGAVRAGIFRNDGSFIFSEVPTALPATTMVGSWGDFDSDGWLDLAVNTPSAAATNSSIFVYRNNRDGTFEDIGVELQAPSKRMLLEACTWADYDGDGDLDILSDDTGTIFRNNMTRSNRPPSAPGSLTSLVLPTGEVLLSWTGGLDPETGGSGGLTYNLRVGTMRGGIDVISPHADPLTGLRRVSESGTVTSNVWPLCGLPPGTYYWSVQSIDPGFVGSSFAHESAFTVTRQPIQLGAAVEAGTFVLRFTDNPGAKYSVWHSADLVSWQFGGDVVETEPGKFHFSRDVSGGQGFFRVTGMPGH